jgi:hypothetical protein
MERVGHSGAAACIVVGVAGRVAIAIHRRDHPARTIVVRLTRRAIGIRRDRQTICAIVGVRGAVSPSPPCEAWNRF